MRRAHPHELTVACTPASEPAVDRATRSFTRRQALLAAGVALAATACRDGGGQALSALPPTGGSVGTSEAELVVTVPRRTLALSSMRAAGRELGVKVQKRVFASQDELIRGLHKSPSGYDVIVPRQDWVSVLAGEELLYPLHHDLLPNRRFVTPALLDREFDPGNRFSLPHEYGVAGFGYRADKVSEQPRTWADFFDLVPQYAARTNLIGGITAVDLAVAAAGGDLNTDDDALLAKARRLLRDALRRARYLRDDYVRPFVRGKLVLSMGWNTDFAQIVEHRPSDTVFILPQGRSGFWLDSWAISAATPHPFAAHAWINHALSPAAVAQEWTRVNRSFAVPSALDKAPQTVSLNPYSSVAAADLERFQPFVPTTAGLQKRARIWAALAL